MAAENALVIRFSTAPGTVDENIAQVSAQVDSWLADFQNLADVSDEGKADLDEKLKELRAGRKTIDDERKRIKKKYLEPLDAFEKKVKPITEKIDKAIAIGKERSDEIQSKIDEKKKAEIETWWKEHRPGGMDITLDQVWDERYLNKTGLGQAWMLDLERKAGEISKDLDAITNIIMSDTAEGNYVAEEYHRTLDLGGAINHWAQHVEEQKRLEQLRADAEARKAQMEVERQTDQKAHEKPQDAQVAICSRHFKHGGQSTIRHESGPNSPVETGTNGAESDSVMYWAEFRVQNATLEQMKQLTAAFQQIGIEFHLLRNPDGSPRKGNSGK